MTQNLSKQITLKKQILSGVIGGFVGGFTIEIPTAFLASSLGMPLDGFRVLLGILFGADPEFASMLGSILHTITGTLIGIIFVLVTSRSDKLSIQGLRKGVLLGVVTGLVSLVVLGLPLLLIAAPPLLGQMMSQQNPEMDTQMIDTQVQKLMPLLLTASFFSHVIYGITIGVIHGVLMKKWVCLAK